MFVGAVVAASARYALQEPVAVLSYDVGAGAAEEGARPPVVVPFAEPEPLPPPVDPVTWCEPIEPSACLVDAHCSPVADGTPRVCVHPWWSDDADEKVCAVRHPTTAIRRWRSKRLRVLVDAICQRRDGCDPEALHNYLAVLALRESSWRPYAVHRLNPDLEANRRAWSRLAQRYSDSPAVDEPWRWHAGRGYYGQNPALWLARWDTAAVPELLCGEVEATLVHLRGARDRWERLANGVTCDGEEHHGTADAPSWYSLSLVNSGNDPCPSEPSRSRFDRRARSQGLDGHSVVTRRMLGRPVPHEQQDDFARRVRADMDRQHPHP